MNDEVNWVIPSSSLRAIGELPEDRVVVLLLRHSVRGALPSGGAGYSLPITETGFVLAKQFGSLIGSRLRSLHSSPLSRCVQTAEALNIGSGANIPVVPDRLLGNPGVFVIDGQRAQSNWDTQGHESVMRHLVSSDEPLPGMARPGQAAHFLVRHMLSVAGNVPGLHVFVTHDSLVTATASRLLEIRLGVDDWPWYLEGAFFWREQDTVHTMYRDYQQAIDWSAGNFSELDVIEFARREIAGTVGFDCKARFFLAGGAFKSILTGQTPRDLDFWAPTAKDRKLLILELEKRGAKRLPPKPFADVFEISDRVVEIPHEVGPKSLLERLARFDIGLSAVGAEHRPGDNWAALIHPLALESIKRQEILLLKPLVNWKYALASQERMRRYADELGFQVPKSEEDEIRRVFDMQSPEMQLGMLERFQRTSLR
jgi:broad specificity phosphatase PhoE